jgi:hypothetical protein
MGCQFLGCIVLPYGLKNFLVNICPNTITYHDVDNVFIFLAARITPLYTLRKDQYASGKCLFTFFFFLCCVLSVESVYTLLQYLGILEVYALLMKLQVVNF